MNQELNKAPPSNCRQQLAADGKPYPRSSCAVCGQFSPRWKECDALLAAAPVPPAGGEVEMPSARQSFDGWFTSDLGLPCDTNTSFVGAAAEPWRAWKACAEVYSVHVTRLQAENAALRQRLNVADQRYDDLVTDRSPEAYAIEHAEYLAAAADGVQEAYKAYSLAQMNVDEGGDEGEDELAEVVDSARADLHEALHNLRNMTYEFRKRRDRATPQ